MGARTDSDTERRRRSYPLRYPYVWFTRSMTVTVTNMVDGDTLDIRYPNGSQDTVRLLGLDTPEVHTGTSPEEWEGVPDSDAGHECLRTHGDEASEHVTQWLSGESVRLAFDENEGRRGYYGRLLAYFYHDDQHVNYQLVAEGYGRVYDSSFTKREWFYDGEATAQTRELRAWSCRTVGGSTPTPTTGSGSGGSGALAVATVHADAPGNDHENENDEYVVFEITGNGPIDLSGWTISDEADHTYTIPHGFTLDAGATVTLYTGNGEDTTEALYWGSDSAIWNNGGDTVYVRDDGGSLRVEYSYSD